MECGLGDLSEHICSHRRSGVVRALEPMGVARGHQRTRLARGFLGGVCSGTGGDGDVPRHATRARLAALEFVVGVHAGRVSGVALVGVPLPSPRLGENARGLRAGWHGAGVHRGIALDGVVGGAPFARAAIITPSRWRQITGPHWALGGDEPIGGLAREKNLEPLRSGRVVLRPPPPKVEAIV